MSISSGCDSSGGKVPEPAGRLPVIEPDYCGITVPPNIAPLNFIIREKGESFRVRLSSSNGRKLEIESRSRIIVFGLKEWKQMLSGCEGGSLEAEIIAFDREKAPVAFSPFTINVAREPIDPVMSYRLLYPGYRSWTDMKIIQRSLEDFKEKSLFENQLLDNNCVNCHSLNNNNPDRFLLHVRGSRGGTYFYDGRNLTRRSLRTPEMNANTVYPAWHPSGRYIAFSSNKTIQSFHMRPEKNIDVYDLFSSLVIFDIEKNEIFPCPGTDTVKYMETFPCWSPDGKFLYYCRTPQVREGFDLTLVKYDLVRKPFDQPEGKFGDAEVVFDAKAQDKSVSLPVISPDGRYLVFTLHNYGTFSIWHREADLCLLDLRDGSVRRMSLNSDSTESYHSWSSNGRWLVFSSKRDDGLTARPYISYIASADSSGKPFILPQEDPELYSRLDRTFNRPEFMTGWIKIGPRDFEKASEEEPVKPVWTIKGNPDTK